MCVARSVGAVSREEGFGPRWRSGRSPSTPVRYRRSTPLSPTTQPNLHISSHGCPPTTTRRAPEKAEKQGFRVVGDREAIRGEPVQDHVPIAVLHASLPLGGPSVRRMCTPWGAVGYPSIDLRWGRARLLRCVAMKTTRLLVLTLVLALSAAIARVALVERERRRRRSRRADPGERAPLRRRRRPPRRPGPQRPRGRAEEDPAHGRSGREDPAADRRERQERRHHLQGRRRAVGRQPRRPRRHGAAQRPERRLRGGHRLQGRRQGRATAGQAEGHASSAPTRAPTTASTPRRRRRPRSSTTASWSPPRAA